MTVYADPAVLWQRVLTRVTITPDGCWRFGGAVNSRGYGCVGSGRRSKTVLAHRLAVIVRDGSIPAGMTVDHQCHVSRACPDPRTCTHRRCVNPDHLTVMTRGDNVRRRFLART